VLGGAAACGDNSLSLDDGELDASVLVCPRLDIWQLRWSGCPDPSACADTLPGVDNDGDGANEVEGDCDDGDPFVGLGAAEVCDLRDNDCDGQSDEASCADPLTACPLDFSEVRCCGATHTIAGRFFRNKGDDDDGFLPMEVVVRRRATGELRRAVTCPATPTDDQPFPYRFRLEDPDFVRPDEEYELIIHLRWYFPAVLDPNTCTSLLPVLSTDPETASSCIDYGAFNLPCL
jgi:hypothetical protein